jgi:hypothetical protein
MNKKRKILLQEKQTAVNPTGCVDQILILLLFYLTQRDIKNKGVAWSKPSYKI